MVSLNSKGAVYSLSPLTSGDSSRHLVALSVASLCSLSSHTSGDSSIV